MCLTSMLLREDQRELKTINKKLSKYNFRTKRIIAGFALTFNSLAVICPLKTTQ